MLQFHESEFIKKIAADLLSAKHIYYLQQYLKYRLIQNKQYKCYNLQVENWNKENLKVSVFASSPENQQGKEGGQLSSACIVYLHGFGSHRLEGTTLLSVCCNGIGLCCFDFSGSGKSDGQISTYGLKQHLDINCILQVLRRKFGFNKFVLWGRSMGATASLLYTCNLQLQNSQHPVLFQVLDSPFSSFTSIAKHHARQSYSLPEFVSNAGINVLQEHFKQHQYNPFKINIPQIAHMCSVPTLFVYAENDKIIPASNSKQILQKFNTSITYEKLVIQQGHNSFRSKQTLTKCMDIVKKYIINNKIKNKVKYKKGIHELFSHILPRTLNKINKIDQFHQENEKTSNNISLEKFEKCQKDPKEVKIKKLSGCSFALKNRTKTQNKKRMMKTSSLQSHQYIKQNQNFSNCFSTCSGQRYQK